MKLSSLSMTAFIFGIFLLTGCVSRNSTVIQENKISNIELPDLTGAYTMNDEIYVNVLGKPKVKPITTGHPDYKPSWSSDGKWIVFFRITGNNGPDISSWKTAVCIVSPDGTDFRQLTSGKFTDYNPTWSREGSNYIIINRYDNKLQRCYIYRTTPDSKPGDEVLLSDPAYSEFGCSFLKDGRMIVTSGRAEEKNYSYLSSFHPDKDGYYHPPFLYILTPDPGKIGKYEQLNFQYKLDALPSRLTLSSSETRIAYEYDQSWGNFSYEGHPLVTAEINVKTLTVSNAVVISNPSSKICELYPAFTKDEKGIVYFSNRSGVFQFYCYDIASKNTVRVSNTGRAEYKYFCAEASPK